MLRPVHRHSTHTSRRLFRQLHGQLNTTTCDDVLIHSPSPPARPSTFVSSASNCDSRSAIRDSKPVTSAISCECVAGVNVDGFPVTSPHATGDESPAPGDHDSPSSSTKTPWHRNCVGSASPSGTTTNCFFVKTFPLLKRATTYSDARVTSTNADG